MLNLTPYIEQFLDYLKILNFSQLTIRHYAHSLKQFEKFIIPYNLTSLTELSTEQLKAYQKHLCFRQNRYQQTDSVEAQNRYLTQVKKFFDFLKEARLLSYNPAEKIRLAKEPQRLPKPALSYQEMEELLSQPDITTILGYRDRTILEVLYSSGIRRSELSRLKIQDADYKQGVLRINRGKGNKDRVTPLGKIACTYIENYLKGVRPFFQEARESEALFMSVRGEALGVQGIDKLISKYAKQARLNKEITAHTFRRSCATGMIRNKANVMHVKELLGHSSLDTVQVYCDLTITDLKEAHQQCHPREKMITD